MAIITIISQYILQLLCFVVVVVVAQVLVLILTLRLSESVVFWVIFQKAIFATFHLGEK